MESNAPPPLSPAQIYRRLLGYAKPYWLVFIASVVAMFVTGAAEGGLAALIKSLVDGGFIEQDPTTIKLIPFILIAIFLLRGAASFVTGYGLGWISRHVVKNIRAEMFQKLIRKLIRKRIRQLIMKTILTFQDSGLKKILFYRLNMF